MVVLSAAICTKSGKGEYRIFMTPIKINFLNVCPALIARQFVEMSRIRTEVIIFIILQLK